MYKSSWKLILLPQIQDITALLCTDNDYVDWQRFLLCLAQPIPYATQTELLDTLNGFKLMDQRSTGYVTREQYERVSFLYILYSFRFEVLTDTCHLGKQKLAQPSYIA